MLGPAIIREIYFRVLTSEQGQSVRAGLVQGSHFARVGRALRRIHQDYASPLSVDALAREASMSVPSFHAHFKAITAASPLQFLKSIRLHQARLLMVRHGMTAATAASRVGYESGLFGAAPAEEVEKIRLAFAWSAVGI